MIIRPLCFLLAYLFFLVTAGIRPVTCTPSSSLFVTSSTYTIGWSSVVAPRPSKQVQPIIIATTTTTTRYRLHRQILSIPTSSLHVLKKSGGSGSDVTSKKGKMQVQLLETIPNMGQSGDIILVSSAVFQNQLKRGNRARLISDEEVDRIKQNKVEEDTRMIEMAMQTKALLEEAMVENLGDEDQCNPATSSVGMGNTDICGVALQMKRKAGPEGNLFGGVTPKMILDALKERYPRGSWEGRQVKLLDMKDSNGNDVKGKDIKRVGDYSIRISLWKGVEVSFILSISSE